MSTKPPKPTKSALIRETTLGAHGETLCVGFNGDHRLEFRDYSSAEEILIAEAVGSNATAGRYAEVVLSVCCQRFGPLEIWRGEERLIPEADFTMRLREAYTADVLYAYACLRVRALGHTMWTDLEDPWAREMIRHAADLRTLQVNLPVEAGSLRWTYKLEKPLTLGGKTITYLEMGPSRWGSQMSAGVAPDLDLICSHIVAVPEYHEKAIVTADQLGMMRMSKGDMVKLKAKLPEETLGPIFIGEARSARSGKNFYYALDWTHRHFFGASSL